jgi:lipid-A-disaccharide synthase
MDAGFHIYIVAAEKSGDEMGAALARSLLALNGDAPIKLSGIGGSAMASIGLESPIDISPLSIVGFLEGFKSYPLILQIVQETADLILASKADCVVLIDSWGFMMRVAKSLRKKGYTGQIIKYVAPQVWATREGRSKILAEGVDHLLTIHDFDAPYFTRHGLPTHYVGNPVFDQDYDTGDGDSLRAGIGISKTAPILVVLFGSRLSEIQKLKGPFAEAIAILSGKIPGLRIISPVADTIAADVYAAIADDPRLQDVVLLSEAQKLDCFAAADVALTCSGTVSTQLACAGVPSVVGYKLDGLTYFILKRIYKPDFISMINIANNRAIVKDYVQGDCNGRKLAEAALEYFVSQDMRDQARDELLDASRRMKSGNAGHEKSRTSERAASKILEILSSVRDAEM